MFKLLLTTLLGFIQNLAVDSACWPHFEQTRFVEIFALHAKTLDGAIRFMSHYVLSLLVEIIPIKKQNMLMFKEDVIKEYVGILTKAVSSPKLQATQLYGGSLVVPADDILRLLKQIWYIKSNRNGITSFLSLLISPIEICLQKGDEIQQKAAMDLLWTLVSDSDLLSQVKAGHICVDNQLLKRLADNSDSNDAVHIMALCVLHKLQPESLKNGEEHRIQLYIRIIVCPLVNLIFTVFLMYIDPILLKVVKGTYNFKRFTECIDLCYQMLPVKMEPNSPDDFTVVLYRGKAFCRLYQQEQKHFQEAASTLSKKEFHLQQNAIYEKAGEVINNLGSLLDENSSFLDEETSLCLDVSMIDLACQVNNLKDYSRCLLCLKKAKLHRSHLCPNSILKAFANGLEKTKNKRIYNLTFFEEGKTISPHGITRWLFCENCECVLSRDGETHFIPKFFRYIYSTDKPHQLENEIVICYDKWLYRFVIGLLFRGLINEAFSSFSNSDKIHHMFVRLRELVNFEGSLDNLPCLPEVYLLISPSVPTVSAGFIGHIYHAPFLFALTDKDLESGSTVFPRACQFFLARIGIMNFLLPFDDCVRECLPSNAKINVSHGKFVVPSEAERANFIPSGISKILEGLAIATQKNVLESTVTTAKALTLSDAKPPSVEETETFMTLNAISDDIANLHETLLTGHPLNHPQQLNFLPPGFNVEHPSGIITLPDGHQVLFHGDFEIEPEKDEAFHITLFLVAGSEGIFTLEKPYVIFHRYQPAGLQATFGFFVNPDTLFATAFLTDTNPKVMRNQIGKQLQIKGYTNTLLPQLMKLRGLRSYFTVVHRAALSKYVHMTYGIFSSMP